jgi:hypothetical protein
MVKSIRCHLMRQQRRSSLLYPDTSKTTSSSTGVPRGVVIGRPIACQLLHGRELDALGSITHQFPLRPLGRDAPTEINTSCSSKTLKWKGRICDVAACGRASSCSAVSWLTGELLRSGLGVAERTHQEEPKCSGGEPGDAKHTPVVLYGFESHDRSLFFRCPFPIASAAVTASQQKRGCETIGRWYWQYLGINRERCSSRRSERHVMICLSLPRQ